MLGALLLVLIGSADLVRVGIASPARRAVAIAVLWLVTVILAAAGLGLALWWIAIPLVLAAAWLATTTASMDSRTAPGILPAVGVLVALLGFLVWDRTGLALHGFIADWHQGAASVVIRGVALPTIALAIGVTLFAIESSNIIVRAALRPASSTLPHVASSPRLSWRKRPASPTIPMADLKGGRLIGPVERLLITALTLAGAMPIVAGLIAAKGIVRYPEISSDGAGGSKAEYFLVGSLVSWGIAVAAAGLIWISVSG